MNDPLDRAPEKFYYVLDTMIDRTQVNDMANKFLKAMSIIENCRDEAEAFLLLHDLARQEGFVAGRIVPPPPGMDAPWRASALFTVEVGMAVDGAKVVMVPEALMSIYDVRPPGNPSERN